MKNYSHTCEGSIRKSGYLSKKEGVLRSLLKAMRISHTTLIFRKVLIKIVHVKEPPFPAFPSYFTLTRPNENDLSVKSSDGISDINVVPAGTERIK